MSEATTKESPLGKEKIGRLLFRLAVPMILAQLFTVVLTIGDKAFIGHIPDSGAIALTAVGVCQPILTLIRAFCSLATMGGSPLAAIKYGEGNVDQAERIVGNSFIFLL